MVKKENNYKEDIDAFAAEKVKTVVWKTPEGIEQLNSVIAYKKDNPSIPTNTLVAFLKDKCGWDYTNRYIFDIIVTENEKQNDK